MEYKILEKCPVCGEKLIASELTCTSCASSIKGKFSLSIFDKLTPQEQDFVLIFLKNGGNIKAIEKELNISYPTVKKMLDETCSSLGITSKIEQEKVLTKEEILTKLKSKEINFEQAEELLKGLDK